MILPEPHILRIFHDAQLRRFGGAPGVIDLGRLDAAVGRVRSALAYRQDLDAVDAAAMLCHSLLKAHAFVDGNKRTAYGAMVMTLAEAGLRIEASDEDLAQMIWTAAGSGDGYEAIAAWLRPRVATR